LVVVLEGMPAGVRVDSALLSHELSRRRAGYGRGPRMAIEADSFRILGGVRHGRSLASPISILIENTEFPEKWARTMSPDPIPEAAGSEEKLTQPRPGHADLVGMLKYGFDDARNVLERSSARETAARVAAGAVCKSFLAEVGIRVGSHTVAIGDVRARMRPLEPADFEVVEADPLRCADPKASEEMKRLIDKARSQGDTLGGVFEVVAMGVPPGLGSYVHWDRRLDARLAAAVMSINAVKAVEIGEAFQQAASLGSRAHDEIFWRDNGGSGTPPRGSNQSVDPTSPLVRRSNLAGGLEGGMTTGEPLVVRGAMKPLSSLGKPLSTVDLATGEAATAFRQRTDTCAVPAAGVVAEAMVAFVLADAVLEKFGGDTLDEVKERVEGYRAAIARRITAVRAGSASGGQEDDLPLPSAPAPQREREAE
jgi:chorismate synthase